MPLCQLLFDGLHGEMFTVPFCYLVQLGANVASFMQLYGVVVDVYDDRVPLMDAQQVTDSLGDDHLAFLQHPFLYHFNHVVKQMFN